MDLMTYLLAKQNGGGGGGSILPDVTPADNGKILGVVQGSWSTINPDTIIDIPMIQAVGTLESPINLSNLSEGLYGLRGPHKIVSNSSILQTNSNIIVIVQEDGNTKKIKRITAEQEELYTVSEGEITGQAISVTDKYLQDNEYITRDDLNQALIDIEEDMMQSLMDYVDITVDAKINSDIQNIDDEDINDLFDNE